MRVLSERFAIQGWTKSGADGQAASATYTYVGTLSAHGALTVGPLNFTSSNNAQSITVTAAFRWSAPSAGSTSASIDVSKQGA